MFIISCSSDNPFEPSKENYSLYFPLTPGSHWKYKVHPVLMDGNKYEELSTYYYASIKDYVKVLGKKASEFTFYETSDTFSFPIYKKYFAFENNKIYTLLSYFFKFIPQGKEPDCWVVIADFNRKPNEEWRILKDFELYTQQLPPDEKKGKIIYYASLLCQRGTDKTIIINGKEVIATEFKFIYVFNTLLFQAGSSYPIKMSFDREEIQTYWLAKSIGVVQKEWTPPILYRIDSTLSVAHYRYELVDFAIK